VNPTRRIIDGIAQGDAGAFREFYDQTAERLLRFIFYRVGNDTTLAEEILQEAFSRLCADPGAAAKLPHDAMLVPWMFGMTRRIIADWARSRQRGKCISLDSLDPVVQAALMQSDEEEPDPEALAHPQLQSLVGMVMSLLSPSHAEALRAKYVDGLSVEEIAERCAASTKVIEGRLYRAREAFRSAFAQVRHELEAGHG
jgi:RNA polymerase sigma-70 factor (ECF subfamily)